MRERGGLQYLAGMDDAAHAAQNGFDGPAIFRVGEEDFACAARFRAVVPALEQRKMALADGG